MTTTAACKDDPTPRELGARAWILGAEPRHSPFERDTQDDRDWCYGYWDAKEGAQIGALEKLSQRVTSSPAEVYELMARLGGI